MGENRDIQGRPTSKVETAKRASNGLRGSITERLRQPPGHFEPADTQILKFHGIYQQDDRDERQQRKRDGRDKKYIFMIRTKNPGGGELSPEQWGVLDAVAQACGNGTMRVTTRADVQFHGVGKAALKKAVAALNRGLISTYGACGDGNRNTTACPVANITPRSPCDLQEYARQISRHLSFRSNAYYEIWLDGKKVSPEEEADPLYGPAYLPRKFKIGISAPDENCIDVLTNDVGVVPICDRDRLRGFTVLVGGGLGSTHKKEETFPRLADPLGFTEPAKLLEVLTRIVEFQRDSGNRADRTQARLKYLVERRGVARIKGEIDRRLGWRLAPPEPFDFSRADSHLGWHEQKQPGVWFMGIPVENGRVGDTSDAMLRTGLKEVIRRFRPGIRLTTSQDVILTGIPEEMMEMVARCLADFGIAAVSEVSRLRRSAMACPALPTCGLAVAEAERFLPAVLTQLEALGYGGEEISLRLSGCPNSCSRPPTAEIGIVGRSRASYNIYVGGSSAGNRLAKLYAENVDADDLVAQLAAAIDVFRAHRQERERFGDFADRLGPGRLRELAEAAARDGRREAAGG